MAPKQADLPLVVLQADLLLVVLSAGLLLVVLSAGLRARQRAAAAPRTWLTRA